METEEIRRVCIREWSPDDRPREKFLLKGPSSLSDAELLAILIGSGTGGSNALDIARQLIQKADHQLNALARQSVPDLTKTKGIGQARAITIAAALELGRRRREEDVREVEQITTSRQAFDLLKSDLMDLPHEEFWVLMLNRANRVVRKKKISEGGISGTVVDPRIIFKLAMEELASGLIVAHNHPSGNLKASQSDLDLTRKLREGGKLLEVQLLDHLIIAGKKYLSFADEGIMPS